jgi:ABC-type uncharacterized transport system permease subunit
MNLFINVITSPGFWFSLLRSTTPLLYAGMAALIASRSGIFNLSIEGTMNFAALIAVIASWYFQNAWIGLLAAMLLGTSIALFLAYFHLKMEADILLIAIAINLVSGGLTVFLLYLLTGERANSASLNSVVLPTLSIPFIRDLPFIGRVVSGQNILVYIAFLMVFLLNFVLFKTPLGLRIRSVGGNPHAAESVGVYVHKTQYIALALSGMFSGMGGAFMSLGYMTIFTQGMVAGRGFIAVAAANVGGRAPIGTMFAAILFGFFDNLGFNFQGFAIPNEFIFMIPYLATIVIYAYFSYRQMTIKKRRFKKSQRELAKEST